MHQPYSYSKTLAEKEAWTINERPHRWDLVVINPSLVTGPGINPYGTSESFNLIRQLGDGTMANPGMTRRMISQNVNYPWRADVIGAFDDAKQCTVEAFADIWVAAQMRHRRMMGLVSILYVHLEKKATIQNLIDFKRMANNEFGMLSDLICRLFPALGRGDALNFLQLQLAAAIGLTTMTTLSETQREVLAMPEFQHFKIDFATAFRETIAHLLHGMINRSSSGPITQKK